jgi:cobalt-zinc-cadmium efflux system protein
VHDLHIWSVRSDLPVLTAHLVVHNLSDWDKILEQSHTLINERFGIAHTTLQPEPITRRVHWRAAPFHATNHQHNHSRHAVCAEACCTTEIAPS